MDAVTQAETPKWAAGLSLREQHFVAAYVIDLSAKQAAIDASLPGKGSYATRGRTMLRKSHVRQAISKALADGGLTRVFVISEIAAIARTRIDDLVAWTGGKKGRVTLKNSNAIDPEAMAAIASIKQGKDGVEIRLGNKLGALVELGKVLGLNDGSSVPLDPTVEGRTITMIDRARALNFIMADITAKRLTDGKGNELDAVRIGPDAQAEDTAGAPGDVGGGDELSREGSGGGPSRGGDDSGTRHARDASDQAPADSVDEADPDVIAARSRWSQGEDDGGPY